MVLIQKLCSWVVCALVIEVLLVAQSMASNTRCENLKAGALEDSSCYVDKTDDGFKVDINNHSQDDSVSTLVTFSGQWIQGGMLLGHTSPENSIQILGRSVLVGSDGRFVFGLGRDAAPLLTVEVKTPSNEVKKYAFEVEQRSYDIQKIEGVERKYVSPDKSVLSRINRENRQIRKARSLTTAPPHFMNDGFIWPAEGPVTGVYGSQRVFNGVPKRPHFGLDIAGPVGTHVIAPSDGIVSLVHSDMYYSGGTLLLDHGFGVSSTFIHLSKIHVEVGQSVKQGDLVAEIGATGRVTGAHLDWRVNWYEHRLDPFFLLPAREVFNNKNE